jgi:hypothetical protein
LLKNTPDSGARTICKRFVAESQYIHAIGAGIFTVEFRFTQALDIRTATKMPDMLIQKLNDEFGQYTLILTCRSCLRERRTTPHLLARICGWEAKLEDVARRMRCSICGKKQCTARAVPMTPPRGYKSH